MRYSILIVGAGQLGSRYLQGLSKVSMPLDIIVSDVSPESLARAEVRWQEVDGHNTFHQVRYLVGLSEVPDEIDVAIIATSSDVRAAVVLKLSEISVVKYWVLEKVLAQSENELIAIQAAICNDSSVWVNTPMYMWTLYSNIRNNYVDKYIIEASFEGFAGLACNAIHYIDFVSRWNKSIPISINTNGLQNHWYPAKRNNFFEVYGELLIDFNDGSKLKLSSNPDDINYIVNLKINHDEWRVFESEGIAYSADGKIIDGKCDYQSQLSAPLVESIIQSGYCDLPTISESIVQHKILLVSLLEHWNQCMPNKLDRLPIT